MIDLKNSYIVNDSKEKSELYQKACFEQGIEWACSGKNIQHYINNFIYISEFSKLCRSGALSFHSEKEITLADLKPKPEDELIDGCKYSFYVDTAPFIGIFKLYRNAFFTIAGNKICGKYQANNIKLKSNPERTKVEYVKVDKNAEGDKYWECARDFAEGKYEFFTDGNKYLQVTHNNCLLANYKSGLLFRKVEREYTWQDEFESFLLLILSDSDTKETMACADGWDKEFIEMCNIVVNAKAGEIK